MGPSNLCGALYSVRRSALALGEPALPTLEPPLMPLPVLRMWHLLTSGQYSEVGQAQVHADALINGRMWCRVRHVELECHKPSTGGVTGHGHRRRVDGSRVDVPPRPDEPERRAHLG